MRHKHPIDAKVTFVDPIFNLFDMFCLLLSGKVILFNQVSGCLTQRHGPIIEACGL
jgi:hypothetical protein